MPVATTSEFGQRAADNDSAGADHGAASFALVLGPVNPGLHGEVLDRPLDDGNMRATVPMADHHAGDVLVGAPGAMPGLLSSR